MMGCSFKLDGLIPLSPSQLHHPPCHNSINLQRASIC